MKPSWQTLTIGDVCEVVNGGTPKTGVSSYWGGPHMWITPAEMGGLASPYVSETARRLTDDGLKATNLLPPNSVILSSRAPIGHLVINTVPMGTNQGCKGLVPKRTLDTKYLYYYFSSIVDLLNELGTGTTFKELSGANLKRVPIPVPPLDEQRRIVAILDEAFEAVATVAAKAEKNRVNAGSVFDRFLDSIFLARGPNWIEEHLAQHVKFIDYRGKTPLKSAAGVRLITAKNVKMGYIQRVPEEFVDQKTYASWMTRGFPQKGDVLFTTEAPLGNVAQLDTDETVAVGQRLITMQPVAGVLDRTFLKYMLLSKPFQDKILRQGTGATVQGIKARLLKLIPITYPREYSEQLSIVSKLDQLLDRVTQLEDAYRRKAQALVELKQSLLQSAFSGELVASPRRELEAAAE